MKSTRNTNELWHTLTINNDEKIKLTQIPYRHRTKDSLC